MSAFSWLLVGIVPGVKRQPLKKLALDETALPKLAYRSREDRGRALAIEVAAAAPLRVIDHLWTGSM